MTRSSAPRVFPCAGCGAELAFSPRQGLLLCGYCGRAERVPETPREIEEHPLPELEEADGRLTRLEHQPLEVACSGCGATISFEPPLFAGDCDFCGAAIVAEPHSAQPLVAPDGVLPFELDESRARAAIEGWRASLWFAPRALVRSARDCRPRGIYLPFWTFDCHTVSSYSGERGEYYYVETRRAQGSGQRARERRTRWHAASGTVARSFDDCVVPASSTLPRHRMDALSPWDLAAVRPYSADYLAGFKAERYRLTPQDGFESARAIMATTIRSDVRAAIGGDTQRLAAVHTAYSAVTFKHLLLPIWLIAYRFHDKSYQVLVNARTGEVTGDRPFSRWKIVGAVLAVLTLIAIVVASTN